VVMTSGNVVLGEDDCLVNKFLEGLGKSSGVPTGFYTIDLTDSPKRGRLNNQCVHSHEAQS
jgi:hypothetical protein